MSYVFSKALTKQDSEERLRKQQSLNIPNKIPPPVSLKPKPAVNGRVPPSIKPKPMRSQSVDLAALNSRNESNRNSVDLTVVGGSEWKDFVKQRQKRESEETSVLEEEGGKEGESVNGCSRKSSTSSTTSSVFDEATEQATRRPRTCSSSSSTSSKDGGEGTQNRHRSSSGNSGKFVRTHSVDLTQVGDDEWKRRASEIQEREKAEEDRQQRESIDSGVDLDTGASVSSGDSADVGTLEDVTSQKELIAVPEDETMDDKTTPQDNQNTPAPPVTLPKPRKLNAELKRSTFSRSGSSKSLSIDAATGAPVIKKSSDLLKDVKEAPRNSNQRHMSFDASTPYFCKQSRQLSLDLEQTLAQCEQELSETVKVRKASENTESTNLVSPILEHANEGVDTISPSNAPPVSPVHLEEKIREIVELEKSPDVVAMKEEIDVERTKIGTERQKLAITINEIENALFDFDALVSPTSPTAPPSTPVVSQPETETVKPGDSDAISHAATEDNSTEVLTQETPQVIENQESDNSASLEVTPEDNSASLEVTPEDNSASLEVSPEDASQSSTTGNPPAISEETTVETTANEPIPIESTVEAPDEIIADAEAGNASLNESITAASETTVETTANEPLPTESTVEAPDEIIADAEAGNASLNESITAASETTVETTANEPLPTESTVEAPDEIIVDTKAGSTSLNESITAASEDVVEDIDTTGSAAETTPADQGGSTDFTNPDNSSSDEITAKITVTFEETGEKIVPCDSTITEAAIEISEETDEGTSIIACTGDEATISVEESSTDENNNLAKTNESSSIDAHIAENGFSDKVVFV